MAGKKRTKNGKAWIATFTIDGKPKTKAPFPTQAKALAYGVEQEKRARQGDWVDDRDPTTVQQWARQWARDKVKVKEHRETTARRTESIIGNQIAGTAFGSMRLVQLSGPAGVLAFKTWSAERWERLAPANAAKVIGTMRAILRSAEKDSRLLLKSPAPDRITSRGGVVEPVTEVLTVEQVRAVAEHIRPELRAWVLVGAKAGPRPGEGRGLTVSDVDWKSNEPEIRIRQQFTAGKMTKVLKTDRSYRSIPVEPSLIAELREHRQTYPVAIDGLLFHKDGKPWADSTFVDSFQRACRAAGIDGHWTPHDLRHHYASVLLRARIDPVEVAARLGDTVPTVTQVYAHMIPNRGDRTRAAMAEAWG